MKIKIYSVSEGLVSIDAKELKIKNSGFRFFIHKRYKDSWNIWGITEYTAGLSVAVGQTQKECKDALKERLKKYSKEYWKDTIKKQSKKHKIKLPVNK